MKIKIRAEVADDHQSITNVNNLAFGQEDESILITKLRQTNEFIPDLSLVAEVDGEVVGHILFHPVPLVDDYTSHDTLSLAPMSVLPKFQKNGIGKKLILTGLEIARKLDYKIVSVLGHPEYYPKFGFSQADKWNISASFDYPTEALMVYELESAALENYSGILKFPEVYLEAL